MTTAEETQKPQEQELQDWFDGEIAKATDDISTLSKILSHQRAHPNHQDSSQMNFAFACCCNMISEQREKAIKANEETLKLRKDRLDSLNSARAFKFSDSLAELNRVFGVRCTLDFTAGGREVPPIVQWSPNVYGAEKEVRIDFLLKLSERTLTVRHNIFREEKAIACSSINLPYLSSIIRVMKWPEIILFVFEHNGGRHYLHFSRQMAWSVRPTFLS